MQYFTNSCGDIFLAKIGKVLVALIMIGQLGEWYVIEGNEYNTNGNMYVQTSIKFEVVFLTCNRASSCLEN